MRTPQKRTNADGTETYTVRFRYGTSKRTGKPSQTSEPFDTLEQAERFAGLLELIGPQAALDQIYADDQRSDTPTLDEYAAKHIAGLTRVTDGTRVSYERIYKRVWAKPLGYMRLHQIDRHHINTVINELASNGKSDKTIANAHGLLAGIMNGAILDKHIGISPCRSTKLPRNTEHEHDEIDPMTRDEYAQLREAMHPHFRPLIDTLAGTGIRWGEAEALQVKAVNFRAKTISITRSAKWNASKSTRTFGPPKTKMSRRTLPLPDWIAVALADLVRGKARDELVFSMPKGGQLRHATFYHRYWLPACEASGITPRPTVHGLRHGYVSWMLEEGTDIYMIQGLLGHESIKTTMGTYAHLMPGTKARAAEAANNLFAPSRFALPPSARPELAP